MKVLFLDIGRKEYDGAIINYSNNTYKKFTTTYFSEAMSAVDDFILLIMKNNIEKVYIEDAFNGIIKDSLIERGIKIPIEQLRYDPSLLK